MTITSRCAYRRTAGGFGVALAVVGGLLLPAVLAVLMGTAPARAHAVLREVTPADGATLDAPPQQVSLRFDEPVTVPSGGLRVFDRNGERVDAGASRTAASDPNVVEMDLDTGLDDGTYVVTWRAVSADGHPLRGAWLFTVGAAAADASLLAEVFASDADRVSAVAAVAVRWALYAAALFAAGAVLVLSRLGDDLPRRAERVVGWVRMAVAAAAVLTLAGVVAQAAVTTGRGAAVLLSPQALAGAAGGAYGASALVRAMGLAFMWMGLRPRGAPDSAGGWWATVGAIVTAASFALEGHTVTTSPLWLVLIAGVVHLLAAAVWGGGLVVLTVGIAAGGGRREPVRAARMVAAFSGLAGWTILGLGVTGVALGWAEVRAVRALTSTPYGWTLVIKLALLAPVLAAALYNRRRLVPAVAAAMPPVPAGGAGNRVVAAHDAVEADSAREAGPASADRAGGPALARLRTTLRLELTGIAAILAVTAVLVGLQPAAEAAGITGAYSTFVPLGDDHELNVTVDPNRVGHNEIHLYVLGPDGRQVDVGGTATIALSQPTRDLGPLTREATRLGPGHLLLSGPELSVPGTWEITAEIPLSRFEVLTATVPVTVNP